jgi:hypothetical protein
MPARDVLPDALRRSPGKDRKGPSNPRAARGRGGEGRSCGGVDVLGSSKDELIKRARNLGVKGRSSMSRFGGWVRSPRTSGDS